MFVHTYGIVQLVLTLFIAADSAHGDWPNWRGADHDGISHETGLRVEWTEPMPLVWERDIGSSFSSFACVDGRLYACGSTGDQQVLYCLNAETGATIWELPFEKQFKDSYGDGSRATPAVHDGRVYMLGGHGRLVCVDANDGKVVWDRQFHHAPNWGYSGSVLIEGDLAIVSAGEDEGALVAMDRRDGKVVWTCGDDPAGYATPYPFSLGGKRYIVGFMGDAAIIADAATGRLVWRMAWKTSYGVNASSPIFDAGRLFLSSGYRHGCIVVKLSPEGDHLAAETVWTSKVLRNKFQSCVLHEGHLYSSDETAVKCVRFADGQEQWSVPREKHGTIVLAQGQLFLLTEDGELKIAPATPSGFKPVTIAEILSGRCWSAPVICDGRLYARNMSRVVCFDLRAEKSPQEASASAATP